MQAFFSWETAAAVTPQVLGNTVHPQVWEVSAAPQSFQDQESSQLMGLWFSAASHVEPGLKVLQLRRLSVLAAPPNDNPKLEEKKHTSELNSSP